MWLWNRCTFWVKISQFVLTIWILLNSWMQIRIVSICLIYFSFSTMLSCLLGRIWCVCPFCKRLKQMSNQCDLKWYLKCIKHSHFWGWRYKLFNTKKYVSDLFWIFCHKIIYILVYWFNMNNGESRKRFVFSIW